MVTADEASGLSEEKDPEEIKGYKAFTAGVLQPGKKNKSEEEKEGRSINCWNGWYKGEEEYRQKNIYICLYDYLQLEILHTSLY